MSIEALCWDRDFEKFVNENENTYRIKIHSIFDKVINIVFNEHTLYTIANINTDNAPYTLKTNFNDSFKDIVNINNKVTISKNSIWIGNIKIDLSNVILFDFKEKFIIEYPTQNIKKNIQYFNGLINILGRDGGCKKYYLKSFLDICEDKEDLIENELSNRISNFYNSLKHNRISKNDVRELVGLGIGLTPSGDDFLTGFLSAIHIFKINEKLLNTIKNYIYELLDFTTDVSASMLKSAVEGKYREFLKDFVYSFLECDEEIFFKSLKNLLNIGSSSGTDMSIGVMIGYIYILEIWINEEEEY